MEFFYCQDDKKTAGINQYVSEAHENRVMTLK